MGIVRCLREQEKKFGDSGFTFIWLCCGHVESVSEMAVECAVLKLERVTYQDAVSKLG